MAVFLMILIFKNLINASLSAWIEAMTFFFKIMIGILVTKQVIF